MGVGRYRRILAVPDVRLLLATTVVGRLPIGINALALVLFLRERTGSFAVAGAVAGAVALGTGLGAPVAGRWIDRRGERVLLPLAVGHGLGLLALLGLGALRAPAGALVGCGVATGIALPPLAAVLRAQWPALLASAPELLGSAYALEAVLIEVIFVGGPLLTGALVALVDPAAALVVSAVAVVGGTAAFLAVLPARARVTPAAPGAPKPPWAGALAAPGIQTLVLAMAPVGFAFGAVEVALPAFADAQGARPWAGVLIAVWSCGSAVGGLVYGVLPRRVPLARMHLWIAGILPLGFLPLALPGSVWLMALLVIPAGVCIAPLIASRNELAGAVAPAGAETEAYTWPLTALISGIALGAAVAGALADGPGWQAPMLAAAGAAAIGGIVTVLRRGTLPAS